MKNAGSSLLESSTFSFAAYFQEHAWRSAYRAETAYTKPLNKHRHAAFFAAFFRRKKARFPFPRRKRVPSYLFRVPKSTMPSPTAPTITATRSMPLTPVWSMSQPPISVPMMVPADRVMVM